MGEIIKEFMREYGQVLPVIQNIPLFGQVSFFVFFFCLVSSCFIKIVVCYNYYISSIGPSHLVAAVSGHSSRNEYGRDQVYVRDTFREAVQVNSER